MIGTRLSYSLLAIAALSGCSLIDALTGDSGSDASVVCPPGDPSCCDPNRDPSCCLPGDPSCCPPGDTSCCLPDDPACCDGIDCCMPGDPNCSVPQHTCATPLVLDASDNGTLVDVCGQLAPAEYPGCDLLPGNEVVMGRSLAPGTYEVCVAGPGDSSFSVTSNCNPMFGDMPFACLRSGGCTSLSLANTDLFIVWQGPEPGICDSVFVSIVPVGPNMVDAGGPNDGGVSNPDGGTMTPLDAGMP